MFEAGAVVYKVVADTQGAIKGFNQVEQSAGKMSGKMSKVGLAVSKAMRIATPIAAVAAAVVSATAAMTAFAVATGKAERQLSNMARKAKMSVRDFRALSYAIGTTGKTGEDFANVAKDISDRMGEFLTAETGPFQDFVDVMGLAKGEAVNLAAELSRMPAEQAIGTMITLMEDAGKSTEQMVFVMESLSGEASDLIPLFRNGAKELNGLKGEFDKLNGEMELTAEQQKNLENLTRQYDLMKSAISSASRALGAELAPVAESVIGWALEKIPEIIQFFNDITDRIKNLVESGLVQQITKTLVEPWHEYYKSVMQLMSQLGSYISDRFNLMFEDSDSVFSDMFNTAKGFAEGAAKLFFNLPTYLMTALKVMANQLAAWAAKAKIILSADWGEAIADSITSGVKDAFNTKIDADVWKAGRGGNDKAWRESVEQNKKEATGFEKVLKDLSVQIAAVDEAFGLSNEPIFKAMEVSVARTDRNMENIVESAKKLAELDAKYKTSSGAGVEATKPVEVTATGGVKTAPYRRPETAPEKLAREKLIETTETIKLRSTMATETPAQRVEREEKEALRALDAAFKETMAARELKNKSIAELEAQKLSDLAMIKEAIKLAENEQVRADLEAQLTQTKDHYAKIEEGLRAHEEAKTAIMQEAAEKQKRVAFEQNQALLDSYSMLAGGLSGAFGEIAGAMEKSEGKQSSAYKAMFALSKGFAVAQAGLNFSLALAQALADPSAVTLPQKIANYAMVASSFGSLISAISGASYGGGRKMGGTVSAGRYYQVNETGVPEVYSAGGKDFLMGTRNASVTPLNKMGGMGGGNVTINNNVGAEVIQRQTDDGWIFDLVRKEVDRGIEVAHDRVSRDFSRNNGKAFNALRAGTNVQGKPGVR